MTMDLSCQLLDDGWGQLLHRVSAKNIFSTSPLMPPPFAWCSAPCRATPHHTCHLKTTSSLFLPFYPTPISSKRFYSLLHASSLSLWFYSLCVFSFSHMPLLSLTYISSLFSSYSFFNVSLFPSPSLPRLYHLRPTLSSLCLLKFLSLLLSHVLSSCSPDPHLVPWTSS